MIILPDSIEYVAAFFGAIRLGAVPVGINTILTAGDYRYLLEDSRARVLFIHSSYLEKVPLESEWLQHVVVVGPGGDQIAATSETMLTFEQLTMLPPASSVPPLPRLSHDPAFWIYSSGTTGAPKGVVHLQQDPLFAVDYGMTVLGLDQSCRTLSSSKLFFSYALGCALLMPLLLGGSTILLADRPTPSRILELAARWRPTVFLSVPTFYAGMLRAELPDDALDSVRACISAGEALPPSVYSKWLAWTGKEIVEHLGCSETLVPFLSNRPGEVCVGSSGRPIPGVQARLVNEEMVEVPPGEPGMLLVKTHSTAAGYWNKPDKTKQTFLGEWLRTGDVYYRDAAGFYWNCGRYDDIFKVSGISVSPIEIENALLQHPAVMEAAVVPFSDPDGLSKPKAFVVKRTEVSVEALQAHVKATIAPYKYPRWIEFVDELPRTATGKLQRYRLREAS